jgi:hypothetical protein
VLDCVACFPRAKLVVPTQGRYVRIQLLDSDYLSLAEVQVMGVDPLRFPEVDYSSAQNDFGGINSAPNYANKTTFAAIKDDGSIMAWGGAVCASMTCVTPCCN